MKKGMIRVEDHDRIKKMLEDKSKTISEYINNSKSQFVLYYKYLTHSDLPTYAKATSSNKHDDYLLYYLSKSEMIKIEKSEEKEFETAKQSNIGLPKQFWRDIKMLDPRETVKSKNEDEKLINNYANVMLVNENIKFFKSFYTEKVFNVLGKKINKYRERYWKFKELDVNLNENSLFTEITLHHAVHGIGVIEDNEFNKLRHHMFKNDILILLIEKSSQKKNVFIIPYKNPRFYSLVNETNNVWEDYLRREENRLAKEVRAEDLSKNIQEEIVSRKQQDKWRNMLAEEMMNYTINDNEVFCPLTYISSSFENVGTLYRASHIKSFSSSKDNEKYDINNGLLLVANADALFDKHLITISEEKEILFSFLIEHDHKLKAQLLLNQPIFKDILNAGRMKYLNIHREIFYRKESERKKC